MLLSKVITWKTAPDLEKQLNYLWEDNKDNDITILSMKQLGQAKQLVVTLKVIPKTSSGSSYEQQEESQPHNNLVTMKQVSYIRSLQKRAGLHVQDEDELSNLTKQKASQIIRSLKNADQDQPVKHRVPKEDSMPLMGDGEIDHLPF